jgi:hypothetical protein
MVQGVVNKFQTIDMIAGAYTNDETRRVLRLAQSEARQLHRDLMLVESKFGMTPSDRSRIRLDGGSVSAPSAPNRFFRREA